MNPWRLVDLCLMALMGVLLAVSKEALAFLPNIELVSLLLIVFTKTFGGRTVGALAVFLLLEGLLYGFGLWWIMYLYVWPILFLLVWLFRKLEKPWQWAVLSGAFGFSFGTLCAFTYLPIGGFPMMFAWIVSGIAFDIPHGIGNFLLALLLYRPLCAALARLSARLPRDGSAQP